MSSQTHAIEAASLLVAVGHAGAQHLVRLTGKRQHIVRVPADSPGVVDEVTRLVKAIDTDAQPLG